MKKRICGATTFASGCICASNVIVIPAALIHNHTRLLSNRNVKAVSFGIDPKKLDLKLNLEKMNVKAMVSATNLAISEDERGNRRMTVEQTAQHKTDTDKTEPKLKTTEIKEEIHESTANANAHSKANANNHTTCSSSNTEMAIDNIYHQRQRQEENQNRYIDPNDAELEQIYSHLTASAQNISRIELHSHQNKERSANPLRTVRGIVNAGAVHDTRSTLAAYAQRATEMKAEGISGKGHGALSFTQEISNRGNTRYSLMDALRDCALNGNWSRSYHFFTEALDKACKAIAIPVNKWSTSQTKNEKYEQKEEELSSEKQEVQKHEHEEEQQELQLRKESHDALSEKSKEKLEIVLQHSKEATTKHKEEESEMDKERIHKCFRIFRGVNATLTQEQRQKAWHFYASSLVGIMRWNSGHFYMLVKVLMECHRTKELHEVWAVMKEIGVIEYMFDERAVNSFISLIRRSHNSLTNSPTNVANRAEADTFVANDALTTSSEFPESSATQSVTMANINAQSMNDIRREMVLCLEQLARHKKMKLIDANERTALTARIAAALREGENANSVKFNRDNERSSYSQKSGGIDLNEHDLSLSESESAKIDTNALDDSESAIASLEGKLTANDFNTLLRQAHSSESTERLVSLMSKLHIALDASSYANIINSLHSPLYKVRDNDVHHEQADMNNNENSFCNENEAERQPFHTTKAKVMNKQANDKNSIDDDDKGEGEEKEEKDEDDEINDAKVRYEAHKNRRIALARKWFDACPAEMRTISVYNEMLYLLRAKRHVKEFNELLATLRGNTVRTDDRWLHLHLTLEKNCNKSQSKEKPSEQKQEIEPNNVEECGKIAERNATNVIRGSNSSTSTNMKNEGDDAHASSKTTLSLSTKSVEEESSIMPANWQIEPNSNTYELLVQRARYLHDWSAMWQLYVEMKQQNVSGTARLYEILLSEAENHPPRTRYGQQVDSGTLVLQLYEEMREKKMDNNSLSSTVSLVRA